jgi:hypothetical protein
MEMSYVELKPCYVKADIDVITKFAKLFSRLNFTYWDGCEKEVVPKVVAITLIKSNMPTAFVFYLRPDLYDDMLLNILWFLDYCGEVEMVLVDNVKCSIEPGNILENVTRINPTLCPSVVWSTVYVKNGLLEFTSEHFMGINFLTTNLP